MHASAKSKVAAVEVQHDLKDTDMYTMIYLRELSSVFQDECSADDVASAKSWVSIIEKNLNIYGIICISKFFWE